MCSFRYHFKTYFNGESLGIIDLTAGELGTYGTPEKEKLKPLMQQKF
jgi:hypothetical protein